MSTRAWDSDFTLSDRHDTSPNSAGVPITVNSSNPPPDPPHESISVTPFSPPSDDHEGESFPPSWLGPYRRIRKLGQGGNGIVYQYWHEHLDLFRAIKFSNRDHSTTPEYSPRFLKKEARAMASLSGHPHVAHVYDYCHGDTIEYIVMEYIDGRNYRSLLKEKPLENLALIHCLFQVIRALKFLKHHGLVHRDIKPSNIMWEQASPRFPYGRTVLIDLGTACPDGNGSDRGSWPYMAPELWLKGDIDWRTDQYAAGITAAQLAGGQVLRFDTREDYADFHCNGEIPTLPPLGDGISAGLKAILIKMTARDPADRYQTPGALLQALGQLRRNEFASPPIVKQEVTTPALVVEVPSRVEAFREHTPATQAIPLAAVTRPPSVKQSPRYGWERLAAMLLLGLLTRDEMGQPQLPGSHPFGEISDVLTTVVDDEINDPRPYGGGTSRNHGESPQPWDNPPLVDLYPRVNEVKPQHELKLPVQDPVPPSEFVDDVFQELPFPTSTPDLDRPDIPHDKDDHVPDSPNQPGNNPDHSTLNLLMESGHESPSHEVAIPWVMPTIMEIQSDDGSVSSISPQEDEDTLTFEPAAINLVGDDTFDRLIDETLQRASHTRSPVVLKLPPGEYECRREHTIKGASNITIMSDTHGEQVTVIASGNHRFFSIIEKATLRVSGVNFVGGNEWLGGAIYLMAGEFKAQRTSFIDNTSYGTHVKGDKQNIAGGGAIFAHWRSSVELSHCVFDGNHAEADGGAIYVAHKSLLLIDNSQFTRNYVRRALMASHASQQPTMEADPAILQISGEAWEDDAYQRVQDSAFDPLVQYTNESVDTGMGGAIYIFEASLDIFQSHFENNAAGNGGAVAVVEADALKPDVVISRSTFKKNYALRHGGALAIWNSRVNIDTSSVHRNRAVAGGGGLRINASTVTMSNTYLGDNFATVGGAISLYRSVHFTGMRLWMSGNLAGEGGAMRIYASHFDLANTLLDYNTATVAGGALFVRGVLGPVGDRRITNSILARNSVLGHGRVGGVGLDSANVAIINSVVSQNADWDLYSLQAEPQLYESVVSDVAETRASETCLADVSKAPGEPQTRSYNSALTLTENPPNISEPPQWAQTLMCIARAQPKFEPRDTELGFMGNLDFCRVNAYHLTHGSTLRNSGVALSAVIDAEHPIAVDLAAEANLMDQTPADSDVDGSTIDVGIFGGSQGALWDLDGDGYYNWPWTGSYWEVPEDLKDNLRDYDRDDCDPDKH